MNKLQKGLIPIFFCGFLSACVEPTPQISVSKDATAYQATKGFLVPYAIAEFIGDNCRGFGLSPKFSNRKSAIISFMSELRRRGYTDQELKDARIRISKENLPKVALKYVTDRGAKLGNLASLCRVGLSEFDKKTSVGAFLNKG